MNVSTSSLHVSPGPSFSISLEANASTGYQWLLSNPLDSRYLELVSTHYEPAPPPARIGQSGTQVFTFQPLHSGITSIALKYCRPWDESDCASLRFYAVTLA
ncbi:protease inhibitor I42 family protein [Brevibacillus reuszeri]|uniref:protease inhibitor I42 family protein n=1 Tax=Brevibacillus reuszeri TaxID=54915 RepID=UPI000A034D2A|nr:protease inhibitor I42 family protein [Brevibacillus reuszeri]MED1860593.1 protease inhibitor I42 family protein [Brevibacillus reuszeri]